MAILSRARLFNRVAYPLSRSWKTTSCFLGPRRRITFVDFHPGSHFLVLRAHLRFQHQLPKVHPQSQSDAPARPIAESRKASPTAKVDPNSSTLLLILQRAVLAYLVYISLCLAWTGISGWYLVLSGRGEEVDERSPLRIIQDATRWPVDAARRLVEKSG